MGYVTKEETACKRCGRTIRKNELQYDSPKGRICIDCYTGKQPDQTTPSKERILGVLLATRIEGFGVRRFRCADPRGMFEDILILTPNRVIVMDVSERKIPRARVANWYALSIEDLGLQLAEGIVREVYSQAKERMIEQKRKRVVAGTTLGAEIYPEKFLDAHKGSHEILNSEVVKVEIKKEGKETRIALSTPTFDYICCNPLDIEGVESCEDVLLPIFRDKLSVKK